MINPGYFQPAATRYDTALRYARHSRLHPHQPKPQPTSAWPAENITLLEKYRNWLISGGAGYHAIPNIYIPMAGHALGLNLKPHAQLDIDADLEKALDYIKAKRLSAEWTDMSRSALEKFRTFLRQERGQPDSDFTEPDLSSHQHDLPDWLVDELTHYQHLRQRNWRQAQLSHSIRQFWSKHTRIWRWLLQNYDISAPADIQRAHIFAYIDHRLAHGYATKGVNQDLRFFQAFLRFLQNRDYDIPQVLLRIPGLKEPDSLPQFLTDEQVRRLRDDFEQQVAQAEFPNRRRDALLNRAAFYLLWQAGLRLGEVEELRLDDLDLAGRKLMVRRGKGFRDRSVYLTDTVITAIQDCLAVRGMGPTDHLFFYRNRPLYKDLIRSRIKASGARVGVKVYPHRLRHTCATQLLNAGCRVTSIQKFLGHQRLNSTMIYARVHDSTVSNDYYAAMRRIERQLDLKPPGADDQTIEAIQSQTLTNLLNQLAAPDLSSEHRLDLVNQMHRALGMEK